MAMGSRWPLGQSGAGAGAGQKQNCWCLGTAATTTAAPLPAPTPAQGLCRATCSASTITDPTLTDEVRLRFLCCLSTFAICKPMPQDGERKGKVPGAQYHALAWILGIANACFNWCFEKLFEYCVMLMFSQHIPSGCSNQFSRSVTWTCNSWLL